MFKKKYPLYYTTNELKRRRTMTDGEGKSSFFFCPRGIRNCSLFFNFFGLKISCPPAAVPPRLFVFKSISAVTLHYLKQITIS